MESITTPEPNTNPTPAQAPQERRSSLVRQRDIQEIMGQIPGGLLRWGLLLMGLVLVLFIGFANYVRVPQTVETSVTVVHPRPTQWLLARNASEWALPRGHSNPVQAHEQITAPNGEQLKASLAGELWWNTALRQGQALQAGDTLGQIVPFHEKANLEGLAYLSSGAYPLVQEGMKVQMSLPFSEMEIQGKVLQVRASAQNGQYPVLISVPYQENAQYLSQLEGQAWEKWYGRASIVIGEASVLTRVLGAVGGKE